MARFVLHRLLLAIPVLLIVTVLAFFMADNAPGDQVGRMIGSERRMSPDNVTYERWIKEYERQAIRLNYQKPSFYFSIVPAGWPDTLHLITYKAERDAAVSLMRRYGNWELVQTYQRSLREVASRDPRGALDLDVKAISDARYLLITPDPSRIDYAWTELDQDSRDMTGEIARSLAVAEGAYRALDAHRSIFSGVVPKLVWHGIDNRYHLWITALIRGDFGISIVDGRSVGDKVKEAIAWTLRINIAAILLAFGIAIPLGLYLGRNEGGLVDRGVTSTLFVFYAIPSFWLATLLIVFFTTPEYGSWLDLFPSGGVGSFYYAEGLNKIGVAISVLFLPVLCLLLGALAYVTRQMRSNIVRESQKDYVRMARAKGLTEKRVFRKHILPNALFPILTLIGAAIPASISGSVIVEVVFNVPGMGRLLYQSILSQDWSVVFTMVVLASILTVIGYIISDVMYRIFDPRLRTKRSLA